MISLSQMIEEGKYEEILRLEGEKFNKYKVVAAIHLEIYEVAKVFASKNSFELAYIYYKQRLYKKSLKILRKLNGKSVQVLASQCLYFLGLFSEAYKELKDYASGDEYAVNLSAIKALNSLSAGTKPSMFRLKKDECIVDEHQHNFSTKEIQMEAEYNKAFELLENEEEYLDALKALDKKYPGRYGVIQKQMANLENRECHDLTRGESEVVDFNTKAVSRLADPRLFQHNFTGHKVTEYKLILKSKGGKVFSYFEPFTDNLWILKALEQYSRSCNSGARRLLKISDKLNGVNAEAVKALAKTKHSVTEIQKIRNLLKTLDEKTNFEHE